MFEGPEKKFQKHIFEYLVREHKYAVLEQTEITDNEYYFAEDHLIAFINHGSFVGLSGSDLIIDF